MSGYTKLSHSIVTSTVWRESAQTRVVWITMLALADMHGEVEASVPGLADAARVTIEECEGALTILSAPDKYSRTKDFDGRRIEVIDGGWVILNHAKYRNLYSADERREHTAERVRRWRERRGEALQVTLGNAGNGKQKQKQKQKQKKEKQLRTSDKPTPEPRTTWLTPAMQAWEAKFGPKSFPFGPAAQHLAPLTEAGLDGEAIGFRLAGYLGSLNDLKYVSLPRFAQTHALYANGAPPKTQTAEDAYYVMLAAEAADLSRYYVGAPA
jgi:hypothetical protein